ncbi:CRISPR-associated helicase Cas3' [Mangrovihabitans endophyticus]|uniref:CRISPR-associated helicase/endonuclease Cas3 n=1 Tax=Mangrovihabitans endophyticus TaxID=1751298 RepID=A0A8J3C7M6_9ACTN|nr:CRISPR-associated helicase Cas3' [Mangrovihabitans endophyticus]GGL19490.1 CRISPR-associated helicase/endonuclease Cas3 [Mangrovihabitans endophyticus]
MISPAELHLLDGVWAKSIEQTPGARRHRRAERLTEHSLATRDAGRHIADRIGAAGLLAHRPGFWALVELACLLHDAGKLAEGFQQQVRPGGRAWGQRHEVLSLAYVQLFTASLPLPDAALVAAGVGLHHRWLRSDRGRALRDLYPPTAAWQHIFGYDPDPPPGAPKGRVTADRHRAFLRWCAAQLSRAVPDDSGRRLWERAAEQFAALRAFWEEPVDETTGLIGVLLQGAVTLADHSASAHVALHTHQPLGRDFLTRLPYRPYPHQQTAGRTHGHLILVAPTGTGKTESGLAWAAHQLSSMPGRPRVVWTLPYRASLNAAADVFARTLDPGPGDTTADIGILHGTAALAVLAAAVDDCPPAPPAGGPPDPPRQAPSAADARRAASRVGAMRLFAQRFRVSSAYQLLIGAIAGPKYSSVLLEQANSLIVVDELHAYDPDTFGRLCAAMQLWEELGTRVAILSATLAPPLAGLVRDSLHRPVTVQRAPAGAAPDRHRLVLDEQAITDPDSLAVFAAWLRDGHSVLLIANTVKTAQTLYTALASDAQTVGRRGADAAILLHSRFRGRDRAAIERRLLRRHRERRPGEAPQRGGLVVATQTVEVALRIDLDRGASELAPIESIAQRAGRVNRLGRHPDGVVEYRVHRGPSSLPYEQDALEAAWNALCAAPGPVVSEHSIDTWLRLAYDTPWGRGWAERARRSRDRFRTDFLTFTEPFTDRDEFAEGLRETFDTVDVLLDRDRAEYEQLTTGPDGHALLGADLLIPITYRQWQAVRTTGTAGAGGRIPVIDAPYSSETGLTFSRAPHAQPTPQETVL